MALSFAVVYVVYVVVWKKKTSLLRSSVIISIVNTRDALGGLFREWCFRNKAQRPQHSAEIGSHQIDVFFVLLLVSPNTPKLLISLLLHVFKACRLFRVLFVTLNSRERDTHKKKDTGFFGSIILPLFLSSLLSTPKKTTSSSLLSTHHHKRFCATKKSVRLCVCVFERERE